MQDTVIAIMISNVCYKKSAAHAMHHVRSKLSGKNESICTSVFHVGKHIHGSGESIPIVMCVLAATDICSWLQMAFGSAIKRYCVSVMASTIKNYCRINLPLI